MDLLELFAKIGTYITMALALVLALGVVTLRNLFHCALCLAAVLIGTAMIYVVLRAEFLAAAQILIYVGAVMTLVIFVIMLTEHLAEKSIRQNNRQSPAAVIVLSGFVVLLASLLLKTPWPVTEKALQAKVSVMGLGKALMGTYAFPFEVVSIILIACLIGAIVIAKKDVEK